MIVTSDSGPIISFVRAKRLEILKLVLQEIKIPNAVYEEIVITGSKKPGAGEVKGSNWIKRVNVADRFKVDQLPPRLGLGEREAIILTQDLEIWKKLKTSGGILGIEVMDNIILTPSGSYFSENTENFING